MAKHKTSIMLSPEAKRLLEETAEKLGISQSAVIELGIRKVARDEVK